MLEPHVQCDSFGIFSYLAEHVLVKGLQWPLELDHEMSALIVGWSRDTGRQHQVTHANDWIVISAITSTDKKGFVEVVATRGGSRGTGTQERRFLVPSEEYKSGPFGFVVDEARHSTYDGPSSFLSLRGRPAP